MKLMTGNLQVFIEWIFVWEKRLHQVQPQHANIVTSLHIQVRNIAPAGDVARDGEFMIRRDADQDWRVALFICIANRLIYFSVERRNTDDRRRFAANRVGIFDSQLLAMYFL